MDRLVKATAALELAEANMEVHHPSLTRPHASSVYCTVLVYYTTLATGLYYGTVLYCLTDLLCD